MHNNSNMRNKQMVINASKILPLFLISRIRASHWKNTPLCAKMGTSVFTGCERQSLQPEIALSNYQNTAYSNRHE